MRLKQTIGLLLLVAYAFFFASANLCYHSHQLADGTIVHSHIFFGGQHHNHTAGQLQIIDQLNTTSYEEAEPVSVQLIQSDFCELLVAREVVALQLTPIYNFSLRAPPVYY